MTTRSPVTHARQTRRARLAQPMQDDLALPNLPYSLPLPLTRLAGREREQAEIARLLATARLLTLTGPGGCGKTRLALAAAHAQAQDYRDGVALVELATISYGELAPQAVAAALGVSIDPRRDLIAALVAALRDRELLLLFDTCEHLIDACARLARALLAACPRLRILATSREALGIAGEIALPTQPLALPDPQQLREGSPSLVADLVQSPAVALFVERATAARPAFQLTPQNALAVAQICRRLDGLPLAIELAAARIKTLTAEQLAARLDPAGPATLQLLTGGQRAAAPRHQSLRAAIDWSYDRLGEPERALFRRLAVFAGGWSLEAAEAVAGVLSSEFSVLSLAMDQNSKLKRPEGTRNSKLDMLDLLTALVDISLVAVEERADGGRRYRLLETIQQYAHERLAASGELEPARQCHAEYFLDLAETAAGQLRGPQQLTWLERLELEHDNLRAALAWSLQKLKIENEELRNSSWQFDEQFSILNAQFFIRQELGARLAGALWRFWWMRSYWAEGRRWLEQALLGDALAPAVRARALHGAGVLADEQGEYSTAQIFYERGLAIRRELGDLREVTSSLNSLGSLMRDMGNHTRARALLEESLAIRRELGDPAGVTIVLSNLGQALIDQGDYAQAQACLDECLALDQRLGDTLGIATVRASMGRLALIQGDYARAESLFEESLKLSRRLNDSEAIAECLENLASVAVVGGQATRAVRLLGAAEALRESIGAPLAPAARAAYEQTLALAGAQLDPATFAVTWSAGRATPLDQAQAQAPENSGAARAELQASGELAALTDEFNRMAGRVAELVRQQRAEAQTRERIEQELRMARLIQQTLLPKALPALPGWTIAAHYRPARAVGGDYYDFIALPGGQLGLAIGDVTDKGVPAALVMATTRSMLRGAAERFSSPAEVLAHTNELLCQDIPPNMFVTCLYATIDPASGVIRYANAGHMLPIRRHAGGVDELRATGMPLGALPGMRYDEHELALAPGESLLLYSDGIVEAHSPRRELFGFRRLHELVARRPAADALLIGELLHELERFTGADAEQEDDITLVTLGRCPKT